MFLSLTDQFNLPHENYFFFFQFIRMKCIAFEIHITEHHHHHYLNTIFMKAFLSCSSLGHIIRWGFLLFLFLRDRCLEQCADVINLASGIRGHKEIDAGTTYIFFSLDKNSSFLWRYICQYMQVGHTLATNWF